MSSFIDPKNNRAQLDLSLMQSNFQQSYDFISENGAVSLEELGIEWVPATLQSIMGKGIEFVLRDITGSSSARGNIRDRGHNQLGVEVYGIDGNIANNYLFYSLNEALGIASKLKVVEDFEILPSGKTEPRGMAGPREPSIGSEEEREEYVKFLQELYQSATDIYRGRVNEQFGKYAVVRTNTGYLIAYNPNYGNAVYVVTDFESLRKNKQEIVKDGDAIRVVRKGDWINRMKEEGFISSEEINIEESIK